MGMVGLSPHHVLLDQNRGAQMVENRERERTRNESETSVVDATHDSTIDATPEATKSAKKCIKKAARTSTTPPTKRGYISPGVPGPLPGIIGAILSGGRGY